MGGGVRWFPYYYGDAWLAQQSWPLSVPYWLLALIGWSLLTAYVVLFVRGAVLRRREWAWDFAQYWLHGAAAYLAFVWVRGIVRALPKFWRMLWWIKAVRLIQTQPQPALLEGYTASFELPRVLLRDGKVLSLASVLEAVQRYNVRR